MVGSHLAEYLLEHTDWEIAGMCRWRSPLDNLSSITGRINAGDRVTLLYGDLRDTLSIQAVVQKAKPNSLLSGNFAEGVGYRTDK
ncbi:MAG: GDP-mannose 4,6-dehydratase, partial [Hyphomicrobiales bacterium]